MKARESAVSTRYEKAAPMQNLLCTSELTAVTWSVPARKSGPPESP